MKRKYLTNLEEWNNSSNRKPLLVLGSRQVGKSYLIKELFAEKYFNKNYLRIDCSDDFAFVQFMEKKPSLKDLLEYIEIRYDFIPTKDNLLIIDEAQEALHSVQIMKQFKEQRPDVRLIVSGSLVSLKIKRTNNEYRFLFPVGNINELYIYPMTFDEFLLNYSETKYNYVKKKIESKESVEQSIHDELIKIFEEYLYVGGMPEAVFQYLENKDNMYNALKLVSKTLKDIYSNYLSDMELYQASKVSILRSIAIYKSIYSQLNKENENFKTSFVEEGAKNRDFASPMDWLLTANVVLKSKKIKERVTTPLVEENESNYRLYLSDMGLFTYQSGLNAKSFCLDKKNVLSGIYFENYIAIEINSRSIPLFYWKGKRDSEFEFLIEVGNKIIPIDAKKKRGNLNSINEYRTHNKKTTVVKVSMNNYGYDSLNDILTIPYYYFSFYLNDIENNIEENITDLLSLV